jgi:DNA-binding transcriptional LysR family regulator
LDTRQLASFVAVAQRLSFTRAAAELSFAQSTVTAHVKALERDLGVGLFYRMPGRIRLTDAGDRLLPYATRILELTESAREAAGHSEPAGALVVGTMESLTSYRLLPVVEYLHLRYSRMRIALRPSICAETCEAVLETTYDCGFLIDTSRSFSGLESKVLCEEPLVIVAGADHRLAGKPDLADDDLRVERLIETEPGCAYREQLEHVLATGDGEPPPVLELGSIDAIKRSVASGLGIALLPRVTVAEELARGELLRLDWTPPFRVYTQAVWRAERTGDPALTALLDTATKVIDEQVEDAAAG